MSWNSSTAVVEREIVSLVGSYVGDETLNKRDIRIYSSDSLLNSDDEGVDGVRVGNRLPDAV